MILSLKRDQPLHPPLYMNGVLVINTSSHKHLGLTLANNCSWTEHINNITSTAWHRLNLLRVLKFKINWNALEKMYISFIRPLLEYSNVVWDNASTDSKTQLESVHNEAARIIIGATKLCSIAKLHADLGWESLQARRTKQKLIVFYKMINGLTPEYLHTLLPPTVQNTTSKSYNLRNSNDIRNVHARTNLFYNSFLPSTIRAWNELSDEIKSAPSVASFKFRLNGDLHNLLNITTQDHELAKLGMLGFEWSAAHSTRIFIRKTLYPVPCVPVEASKVRIISSFSVPTTQRPDADIFQTI